MTQVQTYYWPELADKKLSWGEGPWRKEPDKIVWKDEATGYPCLIKRNSRSGFLCGYVGVAPGHPMYEKDYDEPNVDVHGELTFADKCNVEADEAHAICHIPEPGDPDNLYWFGFDCGHYMDYAPGFDQEFNSSFGPEQIYRDVGYVQDQCKHLARQLKDLENCA